MIAAVCQLHEDKTTLDGMKFNKQSVDIANETLGTKIGASVFIPVFGISGFDYVGTFYGVTSDMAKLMDSVRDRTLPAKVCRRWYGTSGGLRKRSTHVALND